MTPGKSHIVTPPFFVFIACVPLATLLYLGAIQIAYGNPFGEPLDPDRPSLRTMGLEAEELSKLSMEIIDKDNNDRGMILRDFSFADNVSSHLLPSLLAVARDPKDNLNTDAMFALTKVRKKEAIGFLIDLTWSGSGRVRLNARRMIQVRLPELNYEVIGDRDDEEIIFREYQKLKDWWGEHRDETEIDWDAEPIP